VIVGVLPANDFDDEFRDGKVGTDRYRPLYKQTEKGWEIVYTREKPGGVVERGVLKGIAREFTHVYHVVRTIKDLADSYFTTPETYKVETVSRFQTYTERELELLTLSLDAIRVRAHEVGAHLVVVLIPAINDLALYDPAKGSRLGRDLTAWANANGVALIDLLPLMYRADDTVHQSYFQACDGHWSAKGSAVAARLVAERVYGRQIAGKPQMSRTR
jgi:SGNH hydrolase-like domain, acetyltransferase AlgX